MSIKKGGNALAPRVLIVPGWAGSGETHWQTQWQQAHPCYERVDHTDWTSPRLADWIEALDNAVAAGGRQPVVLAAHSLGCIVLAHWVERRPASASVGCGALLVAPPDVASESRTPAALREFGPAPTRRLAFPSVLVGSESDPYASLETARNLAANWGARFVNAGDAGHINVASGHGSWPEGHALLSGLITESSKIGIPGGHKPSSFAAGFATHAPRCENQMYIW